MRGRRRAGAGEPDGDEPRLASAGGGAEGAAASRATSRGLGAASNCGATAPDHLPRGDGRTTDSSPGPRAGRGERRRLDPVPSSVSQLCVLKTRTSETPAGRRGRREGTGVGKLGCAQVGDMERGIPLTQGHRGACAKSCRSSSRRAASSASRGEDLAQVRDPCCARRSSFVAGT